MEKYIINGVEVEYDTFDLVNIELMENEKARLKELGEQKKGCNSVQDLRILCEAVFDFFDTVIGEGTSEKVFGGKMNVKDIFNAYAGFLVEVKSQCVLLHGGKKETVQMNREQRRAAEREKRRAEAKAKVAKRNEEIRAEMNEA